MNLQKIINIFFNKFNIKKRIHKRHINKIIFNKVEQTSFLKKRKCIKIKNLNFKKINFLGNNTNNYYIGIVFICIIIYLLFGSLFKIKNIEIIKQDNITNMLIAYKAVDKYRGKSIFNIEKKEILKNLQDYQHNIENIETNLVLPNTIQINITSYLSLFNTKINNKSFIITENGVLVPSTYDSELKELIIYNLFDKNKFLDYKKTFNSEYIAKIYKTINSLQENIINIKINKIKYYVIERELHIEINQNNLLIFNLNQNIKEQVEKIAIFNKEHINIEKNKIIYIDLRVKNKIFYCTTENEYQCYKNIKSIYSK